MGHLLAGWKGGYKEDWWSADRGASDVLFWCCYSSASLFVVLCIEKSFSINIRYLSLSVSLKESVDSPLPSFIDKGSHPQNCRSVEFISFPRILCKIQKCFLLLLVMLECTHHSFSFLTAINSLNGVNTKWTALK